MNNPDICPVCGASRSAILEMLHDPPIIIKNPFTDYEREIPSENNRQALMMVLNCDKCWTAVMPVFLKERETK